MSNQRISTDQHLNSHTLLTLLIVGIFYYTSAYAISPGNQLYINGFISQGYLVSTENNYPIANSVDGSAEFSEFGINLFAMPVERLRLGFQLLGRDLGDVGNNEVFIDWAYGDYHWRDYLGFRFGRIKMPAGFYNYTRDFDMLRTPIWLPGSVYPDHWRDFTLAMEGMSVYGNILNDQLGEFDYEFYGGSLNIPDPNTPYWQSVITQIMIEVIEESNKVAPDSAHFELDNVRGTSVRMPWVLGGGIFWKTPLPGFRLGYTRLMGRYEMNFRSNFLTTLFNPDTTQLPEKHLELLTASIISDYSINTFSAEYSHNRITLTGEYNNFIVEADDEGPADGWYLQVDYRATDRLALSVYQSWYYSQSDDREGREVDGSLPRYFRWQNDLCLSSRFDVNDHWLFKLEGHVMSGTALVNIVHNNINSRAEASKLKEDWLLFMAKTTFHF